MRKVIFHIDVNSAFLSWEAVYRLRHLGGSRDLRKETAAVAGLTAATRDHFNYMTPAGGVRFFSIVRTAGRWGERVVSHDATFRVLTRLRVWFWQKLSPLSTGTLAGFARRICSTDWWPTSMRWTTSICG